MLNCYKFQKIRISSVFSFPCLKKMCYNKYKEETKSFFFSAYDKKGQPRAEEQHPKVHVQNAEQGHQDHKKQVGSLKFKNEHTNVNGDRAAKQPRDT